MTISVALLDDHAVFRDGLCAVLASVPDVRVTAAVGDASAAYEIVDTKNPDVVVVDLSLPGVNGITATRELLRRASARKVLVLSAHADEEFVLQALTAGAKGYALKEQPSPEVIDAIRTVARGETYWPPKISRALVEERLQRDRVADPSSATDIFSSRENEVFDLLVRGFDTQGIAQHLSISPKTVDTHKTHIFRKLGVHSVVDVVRFAARHGLICD